MDRPLTVVVVNSLSYTGTTWLNLVLGSHPRAFTLGPPDRVFGLLHDQASSNSIDACRVHGSSCDFWQGFCAQYDPNKNDFIQLAQYANRDVIVINNPNPAGTGKALDHPDIQVKPIQFVRDGRAIATSYRRKHPEQSFYDGVRGWLQAPLAGFEFDPANPDLLSLRYEDVLADQLGSIATIGHYVGLKYEEQALRFWEYDHHITAGNSGTIMMIKLQQDLAVPDHENRRFYEQQLQTLKDNPQKTFDDQRWRDEMSSRDRYVFDLFCGEANERFGYDRDRFTTQELRQFDTELSQSGQEAPVVVHTNPPQPLTIPLRTQLRPSHWKASGLSLAPTQAKKLAIACGLFILIPALILLIVAVIGIISISTTAS